MSFMGTPRPPGGEYSKPVSERESTLGRGVLGLLADAVAAMRDAGAAAVRAGDHVATILATMFLAACRPDESGPTGPTAGVADHRGPPLPGTSSDSRGRQKG